MRTGTIQWANIAAEPPFGIEPYTNEAIIVGSAYSIFLWGLQLAAIYVITAPAVAYFVHVRGQNNVKISQLCRSLLGDKFADGLLGKLVDIIFVIALVLGAATTIGLASPVLSAVFGKLFHLEPSFGLDFVMTVAMIFAGIRMMNQDKAWVTQVRPADWDPSKAPKAEHVEDRLI